MKATGIIRRMDELGRVVIPKEIRRTMGLHEGEPLEIFLDKSGEYPMICFAKYEPEKPVSALKRIADELELSDEFELAGRFRQFASEVGRYMDAKNRG